MSRRKSLLHIVSRSGMRYFVTLALAMSAFAQTPEARSWQLMEQTLQDGNPLKRNAAMQSLSVVRAQPRAVNLIEAGLADKDVGVRESACAVLGGLQSKTSIPKLHEALNDATPEVAFAAAKALYDMGDPAGREVLIAVLEGDQSEASGFVSSSVRDLKLKLHDKKGLLLIGATEGAGFVIGPFSAGIPVAEGLLKDKQASGKTVSVLLLATDKSPESLAALKGALADKNWTVRAAATRAVALRDAAPLASDVEPLLDDKREEVQYAAAAALIRLGQDAARAPRKVTKKRG